MKLVELCRFTHRYDFHAWLDGVHGIAQTSRLKKKKICLLYIFLNFWRQERNSFIFYCNFGPKLHVITINPY